MARLINNIIKLMNT